LHLTWSTHGGRDCLLVHGASGDEAHALSVVPAALAGRGLQPMAGAFAGEGEALCFVPRFAFVPGETYALVRNGEVLGRIARDAGEDGTPPAEVLAIHPSAGEVPLNLLRLYVTFSAPMSEGLAADSIRLRHAGSGEEMPGSFAPIDPELWDGARRRLTVLLDPARIKRGLAPHREAGYPLREGEDVVVEVGSSFRDARGRPLHRPATRRYRVGPALRSRVDPHAWRLHAPRAGTRDALTVDFGRPLDHALLQRCLRVEGMSGETAAGDGERRWDFVPAQPWDGAAQRLRVDAALEDVAGNAVTHVFDRDLDDPAHDPVPTRAVTLDFRCA
jgi:hypothetical protein